MAADDRVVVQGDLIRFGLAQYAEMDNLREYFSGATDETVAEALATGGLTGVALDEATAALMAGPSALHDATIAIAGEGGGSGVSITTDADGFPVITIESGSSTTLINDSDGFPVLTIGA